VPVWLIALAGVVLFWIFCAWTVVGMFRLGSDAAALRSAVTEVLPEVSQDVVTLRAGGLLTGGVRLAASFFPLPEEARAGINTLHGAEVGVYKLSPTTQCADTSMVFARADKVMQKRGWTRMVGVAESKNLVMIYVPRKMSSARRVKCCVLVREGEDLVVVAARADLVPLLELGQKHWERELNRTGTNSPEHGSFAFK